MSLSNLWKPPHEGVQLQVDWMLRVKRLFSGKRQSIVKRQAQASPLHNRVSLLGKIPIFFADLIGCAHCKPATLDPRYFPSETHLLPASPSLFPPPSPGTLGYQANFSRLCTQLSLCTQLRCLLLQEAFPDTRPHSPLLQAFSASCTCLVSEEQFEWQQAWPLP